jgi:adenylosuccinate lyase
VDKFCGQGGVIEKALSPYREYINKAGVAELSV